MAAVTKELEVCKASHSKELAKVTRAKDKIIKDYKEANLELQKRIGERKNLSVKSLFTTLNLYPLLQKTCIN